MINLFLQTRSWVLQSISLVRQSLKISIFFGMLYLAMYMILPAIPGMQFVGLFSIFLWPFLTIFIIFYYDISIVHARSRAPAWSCLLATKVTGRKFVTTFHGTYNFKSTLKKFYNNPNVYLCTILDSFQIVQYRMYNHHIFLECGHHLLFHVAFSLDLYDQWHYHIGN